MQCNPLFLQIQLVVPANEAFMASITGAQHVCQDQLCAM